MAVHRVPMPYSHQIDLCDNGGHDPYGPVPDCYGPYAEKSDCDDPYPPPRRQSGSFQNAPYGSGLTHGDRMEPLTSRKPLRVAHVGPSFVCAGVESWLQALISHSDPGLIRFVRNVVTEEYAVDYDLLEQLRVPYSVGNKDAVRAAALESDVILVWGQVDPDYLRPPGASAKVVFVAHGTGAWTQKALSVCQPVVDHIVAVSSAVQAELKSDIPSTVILNGVDQRHTACQEDNQGVRARLGFSESDFVVGFVGRFSPEKQAHLVIDAVAGLDRTTRALLVGWGPLRYQLIDQCNRQIPGRYAFGSCRSFLGDYYQVMNALCVPSTEEGFGMVIAEAMLHAVPVISTRVGAAAELIDDKINGLLTGGSAEEIAVQLQRLQDRPEWAKGLGREGRRTACRECLASTMARRYENLLRSLV